MNQIDLNLMRTFVLLYETGSVTHTAERLYVTQPSVSYALARLRELFEDRLFVRTRQGMEPTIAARQLYPALRDALQQLQDAIESSRDFEPATCTRRFRLALTDLGEMALLPKLMRRLHEQAPQAELEVVPLEIDLQWYHFQLGLGRLLVQAAHQLRQQCHFTQVGQCQAEASRAGGGLEVAAALDGILKLLQGVAQGRVELASGNGGFHALAGAHEQAVLEELAQPGQRIADRGLGDIETLGRVGDATGLVEQHEGAHEVEVDLIHHIDGFYF